MRRRSLAPEWEVGKGRTPSKPPKFFKKGIDKSATVWYNIITGKENPKPLGHDPEFSPAHGRRRNWQP